MNLPLGSTLPGPDETLDSICSGRVRLLQRRGGARFTLDPLLLAHFAVTGRTGLRGPVMELGTGSGVLALVLAQKHGFELTALELQAELLELAQRNVALNQCAEKVRCVGGDWREVQAVFPAGSFAGVISNPPYHARERGHLNPTEEKARAHHELAGSLVELCAAAGHLLCAGGSFFVIHRAARLAELFEGLRQHGLEPKRLRGVHARAGEGATRILLQAVRGGRPELAVEPPLFVHADAGAELTSEVESMSS